MNTHTPTLHGSNSAGSERLFWKGWPDVPLVNVSVLTRVPWPVVSAQCRRTGASPGSGSLSGPDTHIYFFSFSGSNQRRKMPASQNVQGEDQTLSVYLAACTASLELRLYNGASEADRRLQAQRSSCRWKQAGCWNNCCFLPGGKTFGVLKEQQRQKLEEINKVGAWLH